MKIFLVRDYYNKNFLTSLFIAVFRVRHAKRAQSYH